MGGVAGCSGRDPAPSFGYTLLDGAKGHTDGLRGKAVLVNFWATSCVSCVKEMPQIVATHQRFKARGFETLAVAMSYDPPAYVANFAQTRQLPFGVVIDNTGAIARAFNDTQITPTTFLIDKRGAIVAKCSAAGNHVCQKAVDVFAEAYGAECGVAALKWLPYGGLYVSGGIGAKNPHWIQHPSFLNAYKDKGRLSELVMSVPLYLVLAEDTGERGDLFYGEQMLSQK